MMGGHHGVQQGSQPMIYGRGHRVRTTETVILRLVKLMLNCYWYVVSLFD